ncbi:hypothetical protein BY458DRAFT_108578, partial [Sporodiniella umbellata]
MTVPCPIVYDSNIKFTLDGRPSVKDIHKLFSSMIFQLPLSTHRYILRSYSNTFTSEEAIKELSCLNILAYEQYSSIKTTFSMAKEMAKALLQQFLWTRLIESTTEPQNRTYKDKGIWRIRPKGLCVLQDFYLRNKLDMSQLKTHVEANTELIHLIHMERTSNDRINYNRHYISHVFTILIGSLPLNNHPDRSIDLNYVKLDSENLKKITGQQHILENPRTPGRHSIDFIHMYGKPSPYFEELFPHILTLPNNLLVESKDENHQQSQSLIQNLVPSQHKKFKMRAIFSSQLCCNWLTNYCTIASTDEAEALMTEFMNLGWITFFDRKNEHLKEIQSSKSIILKLTNTGMSTLVEVSLDRFNQNSYQSQAFFTPEYVQMYNLSQALDGNDSSLGSNTDQSSISSYKRELQIDSVTPPLVFWDEPCKLKEVLENTQQLSLFRVYLDSYNIEKNLDFLIDYFDFRRRCDEIALLSNQEQLFRDAYILWDKYLKRCQLKVTEPLKEELTENLHMSYQNLLKLLAW